MKQLLFFISVFAVFVLFGFLLNSQNEIRLLEIRNDALLKNQEQHITLKLTGTTYQVTLEQCGKTDGITASGRKIRTRTCAISRDLSKYYGGTFEFGDSIFIWSGVPAELSGWWYVDDLTADFYGKKLIRKTVDLYTQKNFKTTLTVIK